MENHEITNIEFKECTTGENAGKFSVVVTYVLGSSSGSLCGTEVESVLIMDSDFNLVHNFYLDTLNTLNEQNIYTKGE